MKMSFSKVQRSLGFLAAVLALGSAGARAQAPSQDDNYGSSLAVGDFDNDGFDDVVIGAAFHVEDDNPGPFGSDRGGFVQIRLGGPTGPSTSQVISTFGVPGANNSLTGWALAAGDFNNDGFDDLAISAPNLDNGANVAQGTVRIFTGHSRVNGQALSFFGSVSPSNVGMTDPNASWGYALAAGDFNCDGRDDLAIGAPGAKVGSFDDAGKVFVIKGSSSGLVMAGFQQFHQDSVLNNVAIEGACEDGDNFGLTLVAANFGFSSCEDLAVGAPGEAINAATEAGAVNVLFGISGFGVGGTNNTMLHEGRKGVLGTPAQGELYGIRLAAGDFDNNGFADLAVSAEREDVGAVQDAGSVFVTYGSATGLGMRQQLFRQGANNVNDTPEATDVFGMGLAAGDFNLDGRADLAIGVPGEELLNAPADHGVVQVIFGSASGLSAAPAGGPTDQMLSQDPSGAAAPTIAGVREANDLFGQVLAVGDFDSSAGNDLVCGTPREGVQNVSTAGAVNIIEGRTGAAAHLTKAEGNFITSNSVFAEGNL